MVRDGVHAGAIQDRKDSGLRERRVDERCDDVRGPLPQVGKETDAAFLRAPASIPVCVYSKGWRDGCSEASITDLC